MGSDRGFGLVFAAVFLLIAIWPLLFGNPMSNIRLIFLALAVCFGLISLARPQFLHPLNILWFKFGILLGKFITPVVMMMLFITTFTPVAFLMRAFRKDNMKLKIDKSEHSYGTPRFESETHQSSMNKQF